MMEKQTYMAPLQTDDKLKLLRGLMKERNIAVYIVPTDDFHSSEYVGEYFKVREFLSGFTGSAGTLVVCADRAALWTDGRYFLQAEEQLAGSSIELMRIGEPGVPTIAEFLGKKLPQESVIGFDGRTVTERFVREIIEKSEEKKFVFYDREDLAGKIWDGRPALSAEPVWELAVEYAGLSREEKLKSVREKMAEKRADVLVLAALDEIAWLLNLRGNDVLYTPVFLSYMLLTKERAVLFVNAKIISEDIRQKLLLAGVTLDAYETVEERLHEIPAGQKVWIDSGVVNYRLLKSLPQNITKIDAVSPVELLKAVKTPQEMEHMRAAHIKDGVAVTRFIRWLKTNVGTQKITEISAAGQLEKFRSEMEGYLGQSFAPIIGYGAHGAIVHYEATPETDAKLEAGSFCLTDTGGHYKEGTTDITRTIALGELTAEEKKAFTLVLKGHLHLGAAQFPAGVCGQNLDVLARMPLWEAGLDYNHGTGHGVGYILNVHEGPQRFHWRIRKETNTQPLEEGMVISNEPGLYLKGKFGVRHENLVLCRKGEKNEYGQFLYLEPLTMVPFDVDAIDFSLLTKQEAAWLDDYHRKVCDALSPYLTEEEREWLEESVKTGKGDDKAMTYEEFFEEFKKKFDGTDVSDITEHLAYQFNIDDAQAGGAFYVEVKDGQLHIEPYEYYDRDAMFTCKPETLNKIISGQLDPVAAFTLQKLKVDGSIEKALRLKELIEKKNRKDGKRKKLF